MREFLLNSEGLLDKPAYESLKESIPGIMPCEWVRWNDKIQLVYFIDEYTCLKDELDSLSLDEVCAIGSELLGLLMLLESNMNLNPANAIWDVESVYLDELKHVFILCLPAVLPIEALESRIYEKQIYALIHDMVSSKEGGDIVCRQLEFQQERSENDWHAFQEALTRRDPIEDETLILRSINTPEPITFSVGHEPFLIGSDPDQTNGCISTSAAVNPVHACIGWNEINYFVKDLDSQEGTYLNDIRLTPQAEVPFGKGSILRFADATFSVE